MNTICYKILINVSIKIEIFSKEYHIKLREITQTALRLYNTGSLSMFTVLHDKSLEIFYL